MRVRRALAERAGFDGFVLWDHVNFGNGVDSPEIIDPWVVLARQTMTLGALSGGRVVLGVGIGCARAGRPALHPEHCL